MTAPLQKAVHATARGLRRAWRTDPILTLPPLPAAAEAVLVNAIPNPTIPGVLHLTPSPDAMNAAHRGLTTLGAWCRHEVLYFPPWDTLPGIGGEDPEITGQRLAVLRRLTAPDTQHPFIVVAAIQSLMQPLPPPGAFAAAQLTVAVDDTLDLADITQRLQAMGYAFGDQVAAKCQAALRGGLLDLWPPSEDWPARIELFGPTVESIRLFDPATQRSVGKSAALTVTRAGEWAPSDAPRPDGSLLDYLPPATVLVWSHAGAIASAAAAYTDSAAREGAAATLHAYDAIRAHAAVFPLQILIDPDAATPHHEALPDFEPLPAPLRVALDPEHPDLMEATRRRVIAELGALASPEHTVCAFFDTRGALEHFAESLTPQQREAFAPQVAALAEGFTSRKLGLTVVTESDLYGKRKTLSERYDPAPERKRARRYVGERITDLNDIAPGDLVVHVDHGIGRYLGVREIQFNDQRQEVIAVEYADGAKLYVPMYHAHLLSRYVGAAGRDVRLHTLGGKRWTRERADAEQSVLDLASSLLDVQASRDLLEGHAFPSDTVWQREFETAFPYQETPDQERVIEEIKRDMESRRPMDRLLCGDAGYGKTEVAMRAAFKAVMDGKQVAVLVPTTVLAQQHYRTFSERMSGYPIRIEALSRFVPAARQARILSDLREGNVDIAIGTHGLVQPQVRFRDLGLVIIDEEQRFGVIHKERLKQMKHLVDVLTLTATPIPRTLHMSMTGVRDMSLLRTPPRERVAIETIVCKDADQTIRDAILREVGRGGQVFFLHNRVMTIHRMLERLQRIVPEVSVETAHGQMPSAELADVMRRFAAGAFQVLLCTTIVESGMDIPRANTILINRADRFGMADLYQLRGRVGRSTHRAYAYLLLPAHGYVDPDARERIGAIRKHSSLSAGFNLAMRDLELRGAGNMLGAAQSGHIAAVGFGLYCQLLKRSVAKLKGERPPRLVETETRLDFLALAPGEGTDDNGVFIPFDYIEDEPERVLVYRRLAEADSAGELDDLRAELTDRFGAIPPPVARVLKLAAIRIEAARRGVRRIATREGKLTLYRGGDCLTDHGKLPNLSGRTCDDKLDCIAATLRRLAPVLPPPASPSPHRDQAPGP